MEVTFVIASTIFAGAIFYFACKEYIKTHEVDINQLYQNLAVDLIIIAVFSIILSACFIFGSEDRNKLKKTIILSIAVFMVIPLSILYQCTIYQYKYFPLIFFGSAISTILCKSLALIPNGLRVKLKQYISFNKKGE